MIPKIIHYVWLGGDMPQKVKDCIASWQATMPDYQLRLWDAAAIADLDSPFVHEAIAESKYAFASDVIRLHALYHHGGIYLDTDVLAYRPFDDLLDNRAFLGREASMHVIGRHTVNYVTTCCMAAEPHHPFIKRCLAYYDNRHFVACADPSLPNELKYDMRLNSEVICRLAQDIGYNPSVLQNTTQRCAEGLTVYPSDYFDPVNRTANTYCHHLALGTWRDTGRYEPNYTLGYKIAWRVKALVNALLKPFNYTLLKLR